MLERALFTLVALISAACFAIVFRTPKRYFVHTVALGMLTCASIHLMPNPKHIGFSTFVTSVVVGCLSHVLARTTGKPAQGFLIPSVIFMVPGTYVYRAFTNAMAKDYLVTAELMLTATTITLAISFGLLLASWIVPPRQTL